MRYYHIYPQQPCLLSVGGMPCGMEFINIEADEKDSFAVSVTPIGNATSFAFMIEPSLTLPSSVQLITLPRNHYDLLITPRTNAVTRQSVLFEGNRICPTMINDELWIEDNKLTPPQGAPQIDTVAINGEPYLEVAMPNYLALLNRELALVGEIHGDRITRKNGTIESIRYFNDIAKRAEVSVYEVEKTLNKTQCFNIYTQGTPIRAEKAQYPTAFIEAVLAKDYDEARYYLCSDLNESLSNSDLASFFNYDAIYPCTYYPDDCIVLIKQNRGQLMRITVSNFIENIEEA